MVGQVLGRVLPLSVFKVGWFHEDACAMCSCPFAVGARILHPDHHRMRHLVRARWPTVIADIADDERPVAEAELRTVVIPNPNTFCKPERSA